MEKSLFERMGGAYHQEGDYFLPDPIAVWQVKQPPVRNRHSSEKYVFQLVDQMSQQKGITEQHCK